LVDKILAYYGITNPPAGSKPLTGKRFAAWGLAFKPGTDDMRDAPSIDVILRLLDLGAEVHAHDPVAFETARVHFADRITYGDMYPILLGSDALLVLTEWPAYQEPDFERMKTLLAKPVIFDGRNIYRPSLMESLGFHYTGIGAGHMPK
ncbi:MAG: UDP-glucose 6-dehydrogenase, partial [Spirochaetia bacterium]|nr:UDP-glucose 6-dehydrogenase [Spirochaetia bacterium]